MRLPVENLFSILLTAGLAIVFLILYRRPYASAFRHYMDFSGTCSSRDLWQFMIPHFLLIIWGESLVWAFYDHSHMSELSTFAMAMVVVYSLSTLIPFLAIEIRRYRDAGMEWYWIFVPIVNIVLLFMPSVVSETPFQNDVSKTVDFSQTTQRCIKCGWPIGPDVKFCGICGTQVNKAQKRICPDCHAEYEKEVIFCKVCGSRLIG